MTRSPSQLVDDLIAAPKEIAGSPSWKPTEFDPSEMRMVLPLLIDGVQTSAHVEIKAYPMAETLKFRILLIMEKCVFRVDFSRDEHHVNSYDAPADLAGLPLAGPHYHAWADNKRFCSRSSLPDKLHNARLLPSTCQTFDNVVRWVCGVLNIAQPRIGLIDLPRRTMLL